MSWGLNYLAVGEYYAKLTKKKDIIAMKCG